MEPAREHIQVCEWFFLDDTTGRAVVFAEREIDTRGKSNSGIGRIP
jgi:hypothetical protein